MQSDQEDPNRRTLVFLLLGGSGYPFPAGSPAILGLNSEEVRVAAGNEQVWIPYGSVTGCEVGGPGAVATGGGFIGGEFGVEGAVTGVLLASALDALTTRTTVTSRVTLTATDGELILDTVRTPEQLRILLSPAFRAIAAEGHRTRDPAVAAAVPRDPVERAP